MITCSSPATSTAARSCCGGTAKDVLSRPEQDALAALVRTPSTGVAVQPLTATTLCQIAGISRNALYRYHPEVLTALHEAQRSARGPSGAPARQAKLLRQDNVAQGLPGLAELGIEPTACEVILPTYLDRYRKHGRRAPE